MKSRVIIWLVLVLCLGGVLWLWMATRTSPPAAPAPPVLATRRTPSPEPPASRIRPRAGRPSQPSDDEKPDAEMKPWEKQIDDALRSNVNEDQTAQVLIGMLPSMPDEGKVEASQHIANLISDENYRTVLPILLNPAMPEGVHETLFTDLMNRDDALKLRAFVDIAKVPDHRMREEAMSDLQIFLNADHGSDWAKWNAAIDAYIAQAKKEEQE